MEIKPVKKVKKMKLYGFNNLTKTLSFNMYDICYAKTPQHRKEYIAYIDEEYNADRLTGILTEVNNIIGSQILNIAKQDYDPQGASVTMLVSEEMVEQHEPPENGENQEQEPDQDQEDEVPGPLPEACYQPAR